MYIESLFHMRKGQKWQVRPGSIVIFLSCAGLTTFLWGIVVRLKLFKPAQPKRSDLRYVYPEREYQRFAAEVLVQPRVSCSADRGAVYVEGRADGFERRRDIRRKKQDLFGDIPLIFAVGHMEEAKDEDGETTKKIKQEANEFGDIVIGDFVDRYSNLTWKSLFILSHFVEWCGGKWLLMMDDDTNPIIEDPDKLFEDHPGKIHCMWMKQDWAEPKREPDSDWFLSYAEYPWKYYPPYCGGPCYAMDFETAKGMNETASYHSVNLFHSTMEDVFVTGVLREMSGLQTSAVGEGICRDHIKNGEGRGEYQVNDTLK